MNRTALAAFLGWLAYNTVLSIVILLWIKATLSMWLWAIAPVVAMATLMVAITVGNQNKEN